MSLRIGAVGCGNAGLQVIAAANKKKFPVLGLNTSERDIDAVKSTSQIDCLYFGEGKGAGRDRSKGKEFLKAGMKDFFAEEKFKSFIANVDFVFVVNSTGGGTGSSFGPLLTDVLNSYYSSQKQSHPEMTQKHFISVGILPTLGESIGVQRNSIEYLTEMANMNLSYMLFDNDKVHSRSTNEIMTQVNDTIVDYMCIFRGDYSYLSPFGMIDEADTAKLLLQPGMLFVHKMTDIYQEKIPTNGSVEDLLLDDIKQNSLMVDPDRQAVYPRRGYITNLSEDIHDYFNKDLPELTKVYGEPMETFEHFSVNSDDDDTMNFLITIMSGLKFPENRLKKIKHRVIAYEKAREKQKEEAGLLSKLHDEMSGYNQLTNDKKMGGTKATFDLQSIMDKY